MLWIVALLVMIGIAPCGPITGQNVRQDSLPLKPERKIEFTTDEGTWMSVDISPDGQTIIFDMLGDIYTLPIAGGEAKLLMGGMAIESQPRYSPDGSMIVFLSDRDGSENVWVAKADASGPKKLSRDEQKLFCSPIWTPEGDVVLATRADPKSTFDLWMYSLAGDVRKEVQTGIHARDQRPQATNAMGSAASRDGRYLYYAQRAGRPLGHTSLGQWQIARFDRRTGLDAVITHDKGGAFRPAISPDGTKLIYASRNESETGLKILDLITNQERWLKQQVQPDDQQSMLYSSRDLMPGYAFMPDGKEIIISFGGKINRVDISNGESKVIPFTARVSQEVGPYLTFPERADDGPAVKARIIQDPSQSPNGKHIVFSALARIYVKDLPTGAPRRVTRSESAEYEPIWSPDSEWIAYVTWSSITGGDIWKVRADGKSAPQKLTQDSAFYKDLAWSPDGSRIVALKAATTGQRLNIRGNSPPSQDVVWIPAEGGATTVVTTADNNIHHLQFSNDKDRIYGHLDQDLISMRFDGTDRRKHLKVAATGAGERELPMTTDMRVSPDGRWALVLFHVLHSRLYLVEIPQGTNEIDVNVTTPRVRVAKLAEETGADYLGWGDSGRTVTWAAGAAFLRQPVSSVSFEANSKSKSRVERFDVNVERPRKQPHGTIVLRGAQAITMRGNEVIQDADIVVTNNRISAIGRRGSVKIPSGAKVLDVKGKTIVPGFIDTHDHWLNSQFGAVLDLQNWDYLANLAYGVTTGRDPQTEIDTFAYQDLVETGDVLGPRAFSTGPGIFWTEDLKTTEQAVKILKRYRYLYRTKMVKAYLLGNRRQRQLLAEASKRVKIMPTGEGQMDSKLGMGYTIDGYSGNEHAFSIAPLYKDMVELIARSGIFYTPTLIITSGGPSAETYYESQVSAQELIKARRFVPGVFVDRKTSPRTWPKDNEYHFQRLAASAAKIARARGKVCVGAHGQFPGLGYQWELWALASGGMTGMEVLRAATLHGAEAIGYGQDLGSLEVGKFADLLILDKDPLLDIRNTNTISYVMKNGELYEGDTLDQVWPLKKALPALWWWDQTPK
jgi:imidazolonepropionase-like amidohydrolase/Tol biopolymer transport system component